MNELEKLKKERVALEKKAEYNKLVASEKSKIKQLKYGGIMKFASTVGKFADDLTKPGKHKRKPFEI
jgi:hypothetical protein